MSSSPTSKLTPDLGMDESMTGTMLQKERDLHVNRFLFSPLLEINTRFDLCNFQLIKPGVIQLVDTYWYHSRNDARFTATTPDEAASEPEFHFKKRLPGMIAQRLLENNRASGRILTGFCEITPLAGLSPKENQEDYNLIVDIQATLMPEHCISGYQQLKDLMDREDLARSKGQIYLEVLDVITNAVDTSVEFAKDYVKEMIDGLSQRAAGGEPSWGFRDRLYANDKIIFDWAEEPYPTLASPLVQRAQQVQPAAAPAMDANTLASAIAGAMSILQAQGFIVQPPPLITEEPKPATESKPKKNG